MYWFAVGRCGWVAVAGSRWVERVAAGGAAGLLCWAAGRRVERLGWAGYMVAAGRAVLGL